MSDSDWLSMSLPLEGDQAAPPEEELEWERLQRRARIAGVSEMTWVSPEPKEGEPVDPLQEITAEAVEMTPLQLYKTLQYVNEFVKKKTITEEAAYTPYLPSEAVDDDGASGMGSGSPDATQPNAAYSDDIDGVLIGDDIDIDGVPLLSSIMTYDDIDGVPLDGDDIDGVPLGSCEPGMSAGFVQSSSGESREDMLLRVDAHIAQYRDALSLYLGGASGIEGMLAARREELLSEYNRRADGAQTDSLKRTRSRSIDRSAEESHKSRRPRSDSR